VSIKYRIRQLYATAASLTSENPTLLEGEWGTESDTGLRKVGNGVDDWVTLPYWSGGGGGGGATNLSYTASTRLLASSTGDDVTLPLADGTNAGLFAPEDFTKLSGIAANAEVNVNADWNAGSGDAQILNKPTLGTAAATASTDYAPAAQGVTNGNSHDHNGGDGAQIAYSNLSGLPSLGGAAALSVGTTAGTVAAGDDSRLSDARTPTAHNQAASTISDSTTAGRALLTAADAAAQRTSLGLGTAAITAATDYATAAQGTDSREWTASTVSQAEAEAGTVTTRRAWTAERVRQAIVAWWATVSGSLASSGAITSSGLTMSTARLLGRSTAGTGAVEEISVSADLSLSGGSLGVGSSVVTLTGTQSLSNKTLQEVKEIVYTIVDGAAFEIDPANGPIQEITLGANRTPAATNFESGQSVKLRIADGTAFAITWTTIGVVWIGQTAGSSGTAPALGTTGWTHVELWKEGATVYGSLIGYTAS
jgi:hypothetical protein